MTTADKILALGDQIDSLIYHTKPYSMPVHVWFVQLRHKKKTAYSAVEIEATGQHHNLDTALEIAWTKLHDELANLEPIKLLPAIEHAKQAGAITGRVESDGSHIEEVPKPDLWCTADAELGCAEPRCRTCPLLEGAGSC